MDPVYHFNILKLLQSDYEQNSQLSDPPIESENVQWLYVACAFGRYRISRQVDLDV
ncbi:hypothetical protein RvY_07859 [Ramazzottius varieornatus]|uniref:Uncharacterized protein n=1 Tax=Ramazzottius varieornatus TaxID=947166 RepID=A0A1D1V9P0_RAMVA|nr:hypothetical protein RvY_07859 [Ramazzottius varieornatus]